MERPRIVVTGGTGFLGSEIVKALVAAKRFEVTAVDINPPALGTETFSQVRYVRASVLDAENLSKVFIEAQPAIVVHTVGVYPLGAARYTTKGKKTVFEINVEGTRNVLDAAKECGAKGLVYTSSVAVLFDELDRDFRHVDESWSTGRATLTYGQSKTIAENLVLSANVSDFLTCSLRSAPIFGPNDISVIPTIHGLINRGESPWIVGDGTNLIDFVYLSNVADAHVLAVANLLNSGTAAGEAIFITNGEPIAFRNLCVAIWKEFDHFPRFEFTIPKSLAWWLGYGSEWLSWATGSEGTFSRGAVKEATRTCYASIAKARRVLGYEPKVSLPDGLRTSCQHYKKKLNGQKRDESHRLD
ncbi:C-3 sterol dehydrogenase/C-4 decarboxylase-like protein [Amniculicola lignicola CBS 123094]|uniref:C-3 sterol dehydrogenase/C-4 decarboxylase-like protein n=1 Tax=Amniculicola lignicola CBS 123094 TaxID=1392246 RepID=A0A6A5WEJ2_9PLEO|nr:C-3 sterol dehydrogenase/C-4 decarboxylase-like protein [Amniculicola lignicola CBS 123094]